MSRNATKMEQPNVGLSRWTTTLLGVALGMSLLAGCAPGPNALANIASSHGAVAGFWLGLWHGLTVIVTFLISLFTKNVHLYEVHNNGAWYNAGFVLGATISLGGGSHGAARRPKHNRGRAAPGPQGGGSA